MPSIERPGVRRLELWVPPALLKAIDAAAGDRNRNAWCLRALAAAAGVEVVMPPAPGRPKKVKPAAEPKPRKRRKT